MASIIKKSFDNPDETRAPDKARVEVCDMGGVAAARLTLQPGWSWSTCIKPVVGGESCQARHVGTVLEGTMCARHDDGTTETFSAGDVYIIEPGHDGWIAGDEVCVALEFNATAAKSYAKAED
ncbi:MAG: cupin domain-containing protein [Gammaproteobacteria bacterium]|nr:cupin domain-containing protein [Gammaproteobacteria bacterium]